jgi:hypothetical protein
MKLILALAGTTSLRNVRVISFAGVPLGGSTRVTVG